MATEELKEQIRQQILSRMEERGLWLSELSRLLGGSRNRVHINLKKGNLKLETLARIAGVMGCEWKVTLEKKGQK